MSNAVFGKRVQRPTLSLELFPPRQDRARSQTWSRLDRLLAAGPDFVSVTYRPSFVTAADGVISVAPVRNDSEDVVAHVVGRSEVPIMAHLTCIGYTRADVEAIVRHFLDAGVRRFLALRGDPPMGKNAEDVTGELPHAVDLVRVIREVEADYFGDGRRHLMVAVAAYPYGLDHGEEAHILAGKQAAGADLAITQVFYQVEDYEGLVRAASYAGVTMPILPGVIPLTDLRRLTRLEQLTGVPVPQRLHDTLAGATGSELVRCGISATLDLASGLLDVGAPGLHLYTFNRTRPALDVVTHLRLGGIVAGGGCDPATQELVNTGYLNATPG